MSKFWKPKCFIVAVAVYSPKTEAPVLLCDNKEFKRSKIVISRKGNTKIIKNRKCQCIIVLKCQNGKIKWSFSRSLIIYPSPPPERSICAVIWSGVLFRRPDSAEHVELSLTCALFGCELMENPNFSARYHRSGSQEQLVTKMNDEEEEDDYDEEDDDEEEEEDLKEHDYDFVQVSVSPKHIHFVTDASLSSWSDPETVWEKTTCLG